LRNVYCIGETVLDIIFKDGDLLAARPGGSMLNSAVSLGRSGTPVHFISDFGADPPGDLVDQYLQENKVDTRFIDRFSDGKTAISLAFLDASNNADYTFFRVFPKTRLKLLFPNPTTGDIVLFGSFFSIDRTVRSKVIRFIRKARNSGALIIYDPNFRKPHARDLPALLPWILENISLSDIVRGSDEDFIHIFGVRKGCDAFSKVRKAGCLMLIYTRNRKGIEVYCGKLQQNFPVPNIRPESTIGAGDAFNAGLISGLLALGNEGIVLEQGRWKVARTSWKPLIDRAIAFATDVCLALDNSISEELATRVKNGQMALGIHP
jgi:fructokinase